MADEPEVFEKLQGLAWQFLHDGPRLLRATELRLATAQASMPEQALLRERIRVLHRYGNLTAAHGQPWPPPLSAAIDGHLPWPREGCGSFPTRTSALKRTSGLFGLFGADDGGWQTATSAARQRWGGEDSCTIRVLSLKEWEDGNPECLAALFTRPFLVQGGAEAVVNRR